MLSQHYLNINNRTIEVTIGLQRSSQLYLRKKIRDHFVQNKKRAFWCPLLSNWFLIVIS